MDGIVDETKAVIIQHNSIPYQAILALTNSVVSGSGPKLMLHTNMYVPGCSRGRRCIFRKEK